ncbi:putative quinol monooxygenase [Algimonas porphyrae]|uniref:ABM domain-containing protein n=1 Tax=Algimonas porphyrae TaxID=1128113 RepID=A0ABQ5V2I3_9PROT|nr:antibiotic biosynthesis monooxygenase family protein [Algimonas porphyrae]GLQ21738.1 hypothetical protein GCM10007854_26930 [Algimonas porphyrae]
MTIRPLLAGLCLLAFALAGCAAADGAAVAADTTSDDAVTLVIRFDANDDGLAELSAIMNGVSDAMASEPGFVSATVMRNIDDPNVFLLTEIWESKALHLEHFDRINDSGDWAMIKSLLVADPQMGYYRVE